MTKPPYTPDTPRPELKDIPVKPPLKRPDLVEDICSRIYELDPTKTYLIILKPDVDTDRVLKVQAYLEELKKKQDVPKFVMFPDWIAKIEEKPEDEFEEEVEEEDTKCLF